MCCIGGTLNSGLRSAFVANSKRLICFLAQCPALGQETISYFPLFWLSLLFLHCSRLLYPSIFSLWVLSLGSSLDSFLGPPCVRSTLHLASSSHASYHFFQYPTHISTSCFFIDQHLTPASSIKDFAIYHS